MRFPAEPPQSRPPRPRWITAQQQQPQIGRSLRGCLNVCDCAFCKSMCGCVLQKNVLLKVCLLRGGE